MSPFSSFTTESAAAVSVCADGPDEWSDWSYSLSRQPFLRDKATTSARPLKFEWPV